MGQTDKQFNAFLRLVITSLKKALAEQEPEKIRAQIQELLNDLQTSLED